MEQKGQQLRESRNKARRCVAKLRALTVKDLAEVAKDFGVVSRKTKKASLDAILEKISRRKTTHARTLF